MIIKILSENTAVSPSYNCEHGLSICLETSAGKILFDTGASDLFLANAAKLDLKLEDVKLAILSHGHYDHGGGLGSFIKANKNAPIYASKYAFGDYYSVRQKEYKYIGLDKKLESSGRFVFTDSRLQLNQNISLYSTESHNFPEPSGNSRLLEKTTEGEFIADSFRHEINLVIRENNKFILVAGCAHKGILNIVEQFVNIYGIMPDIVISGFHLYNRHDDSSEPFDYINQIGLYLKTNKISCYTGHCTGQRPYRQLKEIMGESLRYISAGSVIEL